MTTVTFFSEEERIVGFTACGHSGYGEAGEDIVCAAVTSALRLVECTINDVLGIEASVKVREKDASITLKLPGGLGELGEHTCQNLLSGFMVYLVQLWEEYPDHLRVVEEEISAT